MGLNEDEYWNEYHVNVEAPKQLIKGRVQEYINEQGLKPINPNDIEGEILQMDYYKGLG